MKKTTLIIFTFLINFLLTAQEKKKIDIKNADFTYINNDKHPDYWRLIGDVNIYHNKTDMFCDSAHYYSEKEKIIAFKNVKITKGDSINLYGEKLNYDGEKSIAVISKNVVFKNSNSNLKSNQLTYNINEEKIFYVTRSSIVKNEKNISSNEGVFFVEENKYEFRDSVILKSEKYSVKTDNLIFLEDENLNYLIGPSKIFFDDKTIYCEEGNLYNDKAEFYKNSYIQNNDIKINADSIFYDDLIKSLNTFGNVILTDTINNMLLSGEEADFFENEEKMIFKKNPLLKLISDSDTLFISANKFENFIINDKNLIKAFTEVKFTDNNIIGKCDSLTYYKSDSIITMYNNPIIWLDEYQVFSDTIRINYFDKKINKMYLDSKPMIISNLDSLEYNQIKGKIMIGNFKDNKLKTMNVSGNGQSIYFLKEKEETIGMNYLESSSINLHFIDKKINNINYEVIPHSLTKPVEDLKNEDRFLKEFEWRIKEKPTKKEIINQ